MPVKGSQDGKTRIGDRYGRWSVIAMAPARGRATYWLCRCECGREREVVQRSLRNLASRSCGCLKREYIEQLYAAGNKRFPENNLWNAMKSRVFNPNNPDYNRYGGRGITICERWLNFQSFIADVGRRPSPKHSLHRIDNNGNYEPGNVRWATAKEQARNTSATRWLELGGEKRSLAEWAERYNISTRVLGKRLDRYGWSLIEALTIPIGGKRCVDAGALCL